MRTEILLQLTYPQKQHVYFCKSCSLSFTVLSILYLQEINSILKKAVPLLYNRQEIIHMAFALSRFSKSTHSRCQCDHLDLSICG